MKEEFLDQVKEEAERAALLLLDAAKLSQGDILVVGCSSSEVTGERIGTFTVRAASVHRTLYIDVDKRKWSTFLIDHLS